jgi:hypothetical protein
MFCKAVRELMPSFLSVGPGTHFGISLAQHKEVQKGETSKEKHHM